MQRRMSTCAAQVLTMKRECEGCIWSLTRRLTIAVYVRLQALEAAFAQFGPVAKAVVVSDAHANTSRRLVALQGCAMIPCCVSSAHSSKDGALCCVELLRRQLERLARRGAVYLCPYHFGTQNHAPCH